MRLFRVGRGRGARLRSSSHAPESLLSSALLLGILALLVGSTAPGLPATVAPAPRASPYAADANDLTRAASQVAAAEASLDVAPIPRAAAPDPVGWRASAPGVEPSARWGAAEAYDPALGELVLFGGTDGTSYLNDTWVYTVPASGPGVWKLLSGAPAPNARAFAAMAFDETLGELVLFGGIGAGGGYENTTWVFGATGWSLLTSNGPSRRAGVGLTFDESTGRLLLFGGTDGKQYYDDLWALNGSTWQSVATTGAPPPRAFATFAFDPGLGLVVLVGGRNATAIVPGCSALNGTAWGPGPSAGQLPATSDSIGVFDDADGVLLVAGGNNSSGLSATTYELTSSGTWETPVSPVSAPAVSDAAATFDDAAGTIFVVGGWNGSAVTGSWTFSLSSGPLTWTLLNVPAPPAPYPSRRTEAAIAYDPADGYVVMFGGENHSSNGTLDSPLHVVPANSSAPSDAYYNQTWIFRDFRWTKLTTNPTPPARRGALMTYDYRDGYLVLFGGCNNTTYFNDTWTFRGGVWKELFPRTSPEARRSFGFTYDMSDGEVLLFGGHNGTPSAGSGQNVTPVYTYFNDLWAFAGGTWTKLHPGGATPPAEAEPFFAYDPGSGSTLLFGGYHWLTKSRGPNNTGFNEHTMNYTFVYANGDWTNLSTQLADDSPSVRDWGGIAFDYQTGAMVIWGGSFANPVNRSEYDQPVNSSWSFKNDLWTELCNGSACPPYGRATDHGTYDFAIGGLLTFGGQMGQGNAGTSVGSSALAASVALSPPDTDVDHPVRVTASIAGGYQPYSDPTLTIGNGTPIAGLTATATFSIPGTYPVVVSAVDGLGNVTQTVVNLSVEPALSAASLDARPWGPNVHDARLNVSLTGGAPPFLYNFSLGDGRHEVTTTGSVVNYYSSGNYTASVTVTDVDGETASAVSGTFSLPAIAPVLNLTVNRSKGVAVSGLIGFDARVIDPYGGVSYRWNATNGTFVAEGPNASLRITSPGTFRANVTIVDASNFTKNASVAFVGLPALAAFLNVSIGSSISCPIGPTSMPVTFNASAAGGGGPPYSFRWTAPGIALSGNSTTVGLTPGAQFEVEVTVEDAALDNASTNRSLALPLASCGPGSVLPPRVLDALVIGGVVLGAVIIAEVLYLRRQRRRAASRASAPSPPGSSTP